jgi:uncharacterized protein YecA (UPF0149 family)
MSKKTKNLKKFPEIEVPKGLDDDDDDTFSDTQSWLLMSLYESTKLLPIYREKISVLEDEIKALYELISVHEKRKSNGE